MKNIASIVMKNRTSIALKLLLLEIALKCEKNKKMRSKRTSSRLSEEVLACLYATCSAVTVLVIQILSFRREQVPRWPINNTWYIFTQDKLNDPPNKFRDSYRMYPNVFRKLCFILREKCFLENSRYICVEEMVGQFLYIVGHSCRYGVTRDIFKPSKWTLSKNFNKVLNAIVLLAPDLMVNSPNTTPVEILSDQRFFPYFKDCIEAIDGTHIPAMVTNENTMNYRNRKGQISQNVLAACTFDLMFIYVLSGWEGSANDARILNSAFI